MPKLINLLPDIKQNRLKSQRVKHLTMSIAVFLMIAAIALPVTLFLINQGQKLYVKRIQDQINERQDTVKNTPNITTMLTVKDHMASLPTLYDQRLYVTKLLSYLPSITPSDIRFNNLGIDTSGHIIISGTTLSYSNVDKFYQAMLYAGVNYDPNAIEADPNAAGNFTNVVLESAGGTSGQEVQFTISADFKPDLVSATEAGDD